MSVVDRRAPVLVVTGPTGGGKSTACGWLAERGAFVLDADRIGHEMLLEPALRDAIVVRFGDAILDADGEIVRRRLGELVFSSEEDLRELERIVHPPLVGEIQRRIERLHRSRGPELIVVDAALHGRFEPAIACDAVLGVTASASVRKSRIMLRDGIDDATAEARMARQADVLARLPQADRLLVAEGGPEALRAELFATVDELLGTRLVASDPTPDSL